jgi:hypothetical protein
LVRRQDLTMSITAEDDLGTHGDRMLSGHAPMMLRERDLRRMIELERTTQEDSKINKTENFPYVGKG